MTGDLTKSEVSLVAGAGFTDAQPNLTPLQLETYVQLTTMRAQRYLGGDKTINWTDHADVTRVTNVPAESADSKVLRRVAEIVGDGTAVHRCPVVPSDRRVVPNSAGLRRKDRRKNQKPSRQDRACQEL